MWCSPEKQIAADRAISDRQDRKTDGGRRAKTTRTRTRRLRRRRPPPPPRDFLREWGPVFCAWRTYRGGRDGDAVLLQLEVGVWVGDDVWGGGGAKEEKKRRENTNERD